MLGAVIIVVVVVIALPVAYLVTGAVLAAVMGWSLKGAAEDNHPGSELTDLNY